MSLYSQISSEIGKDNYLICMVYPNIIKLKTFIANLSSINIRGFGNVIIDRIYSAYEIQIAITAFFLTIEGRRYFLNQVDQNQKKNYLNIIQKYILQYNEFKFKFDENIIKDQINSYMELSNFEVNDSFLFWQNNRNSNVNNLNFLANIAIRIINMACSELPVERLFSHLKYLYGSKDYNKSDDLLNAQLAIRMENIYSGENK